MQPWRNSIKSLLWNRLLNSCVKSWFLCRPRTAAPANDLQLRKLLEATGSPASIGALKKLCRQLWYLSEELVAVTFFDRDVNGSEKNAIAKRLSHDGTNDPPKHT